MDVLLALYATIGLGLALELEAAVEEEAGPFLAPRAEPVLDQIANLRFGLDLALAVGALPDPSPGGRVNGGVGFPLGMIDLWIEAGFTGWRPSETDRFDADLGLCALVPLQHFEMGGCAGARFGKLSLLAASAELRAGWKPIDVMVLLIATGGSIDLLDNGDPSRRAYGVFRAGVQWRVW